MMTVTMCAHSCLTLHNTIDCSPLGPSVHGIFQARILEQVAISFSRGSSQPRDWTQISCIAGRFFTVRATKETLISYVLSHFSRLQLLATLWTIAHQAPLSMGSSRMVWVAISRGSSQTRDQTHISCISCIGRQILHTEKTGKPLNHTQIQKKNFF